MRDVLAGRGVLYNELFTSSGYFLKGLPGYILAGTGIVETPMTYLRGARCETGSIRGLRAVVAFDHDDIDVHGARAQCPRLGVFG